MRIFHIARAADWEAARDGGTGSFSRLFLEEIMFRAAIGIGVMVVAGAAGLIAQRAYGDAVALPVTLLALVVALLGAVVLTRRRNRALRR